MSTIASAGIQAAQPLLPEPATVAAVIRETETIRSYRLVFDDPGVMAAFSFLPGQIGLVSVMGAGESTFAISSPPSEKEYFQFSVMKTGVVTGAIHELGEGDKVAVRVPMGCAFPIDDWKGKNVMIVAGGIGMAPLRSLLLHLLDHREDYGKLQLIYGARTPADLCYAGDRQQWEERGDLDAVTTIDVELPEWTGRAGLVPAVMEESGLRPENTVAVICGPPVMIKFVLASLDRMGYREGQIYTTLERRMKCGIGLCGRCNVGPKYVCTDGPVFSLESLRGLPDEL